MTVLARLMAELGSDLVTPGPDVPAPHRTDWSGEPAVQPLALVRPRTTAEVQAVLRACHDTGTPVVPQGGRSGLCGGARPLAGGVALSLDRMSRVLDVDARQATLTAEAGCVLQVAQSAAAEAGMLLGVDLGARGTCTLGGIIGTNAGGNQVLRYGMTRENVLGLEIVLADGTLLPAMNRLLKNNVGIDLKHLAIGAEGCLGIVTKAVFRLHPRPTHTATAFVGCADAGAMLDLLAHARATLGPALTSFEAMWPSFYDIMRAGIAAPHPLDAEHGLYVILQADGFDASVTARLEDSLGAAMSAGIVADATLARNSREDRALWAVREAVAEYGRILGPLTPFDIGIPLEHMAQAVARMDRALRDGWQGVRALFYGHMGDSNLHLVVNVPGVAEQPSKAIKALIYDITRDLGGTVSAEHGIGTTKRDVIGHSRSTEEIAAMRAVKAALDPRGILNPGRGFAA